MFELACPECGTIRNYKRKNYVTKAINEKTLCRNCALKGERNGFFGKKHSDEARIALSLQNRKVSKEAGDLSAQEIQDILNPCLERKCWECSTIIVYTTRGARIRAEAEKALCGSCSSKGSRNSFFGKAHSEATKVLLSAANTGKHNSQKTEFTTEKTRGRLNSMYGRSVYDVWLAKHGKEEADKLLVAFKEKQSKNSSGKNNPMYGKPAPRGSGNGWKGWYKGWFFRSLRELSYALHLDEQKLPWKSAETKDLQISYTDFEGNERTYRADFLVEEKYLIEIKPSKLITGSPLVKLKEEAAKIFCQTRGLIYQLVDAGKLDNKKISGLYKEGIIKFTERYQKLYLEKYSNTAA